MGAFSMKDWFPTANPVHRLDPTPILRALFTALDSWACDGLEPPPSQVPRRGERTAVERVEVLRRFPHAARPDEDTLPWTPVIDPESTTWPLELGKRLVALVSDVDEDGNEIAGIRLPAVAVPAAAYTGWNPRRPVDGLPDVLYEFVGSRVPLQSGRPLPDRVTYEAAVRAAALQLVATGFLLHGDVDSVVAEAMDLFDQA